MTAQATNERGAGSSGDITDTAPAHTGSRTTRVLGVITLVAVALWAFLGLYATPPDVVQGEAVRLIYVHVPVVMTAFLAAFITSVASAVWLWKRSQWWDLVASSSAELSAVFTAATLLTGAIWGGAAWGTFWVWDARLTSTAMLMLLLLGYLALRGAPGSPESQARRAAIVGLLLVPNVMIVRQSVDWWRSLHQPATINLLGNTQIRGVMLFTFVFGLAVMALVWLWLMIHRFRVGWLEHQIESSDLAEAITQRRAEGGA